LTDKSETNQTSQTKPLVLLNDVTQQKLRSAKIFFE